MMRVTRLVLLWTALLVAGASTAQAQTSAPADDGRFYAGGAVGTTIGNSAGLTGGIEVSGRVWEQVEVFIEAGRMRNVATEDVERRAQVIADYIHGSASTVQRATYFDVGGRYRFAPFAGIWRPYVGLGFGVAKVETTATFTVNGADVTGQLLPVYGVMLGNDLSGSLNKVFITIPVGVQATITKRLAVGVSYRWGRILADTSAIDQDVSIAAQRVQFDFGVRF
jgi:opacity protein-like surface antigen